jgi:hypothetical protein
MFRTSLKTSPKTESSVKVIKIENREEKPSISIK